MAKQVVAHITLTGISPLLMHADDISQCDRLEAWRSDPANKNLSVKGDDRSPPWTWMTYLYTDGRQLVVPVDNLMACLRDAGSKVVLKKTTTMKAITQSGLFPLQDYLPLLVNGKPIRMADLEPCREFTTFTAHREHVEKLGFALFCKRARIGMSKHVRVRPRFEDWSCELDLEVLAPEITKEHLERVLQVAGDRQGLCDWRPGAVKGGQPGRFGRFKASVVWK